MTTTPKPSLRRLIDANATSIATADTLRQAADLLANLSTNEVLRDEVKRLRTMADEYDADADCTMEEIMERFTPAEFEAAMR
jgi:hypothetical protein